MNSANIDILSQNQAYQTILEKFENILKSNMTMDNIVSLTGAAGTGKTYLTTKLVKRFSEKYNVTITAPTHKALQILRVNLESEEISNVDTKTLQSFLNIRLNTDYNNGVQKFERIKSKKKDLSKTDILIVDESSMVSQDLYDYIVASIEDQRVKAVLFVGDENQLLPIDSMNNKVFEISSKYKLEKIVRQAKDSYIINIATKARNIIKSKNYTTLQEFLKDAAFSDKIEFFTNEKKFHDDFCTPDTWAKQDKVIASFTNGSVDKHNKEIRKRFWEVQGESNIPTLLKGDKVIFQEANIIDDKVIHQNSDIVKLSFAKKIYNNELKVEYWDCKDLNNKPFKVINPEHKNRLKYVLDEIAKKANNEKRNEIKRKIWKMFYNIKETFINVKYTYASTIHKLQGSTYGSVYIDLREIENMNDKDMMFRLLYVAITRASDTVKILLPDNIDESLSYIQEDTIRSIGSDLKSLGFDL